MTFPRPEFMKEALALARKGVGRTSPNPVVGAVLVRNGQIVGRGYHRAAGEAHAEVEALRDAGDAARGADLYVTLEPCAHTGRTGPCTEAILAAGIRRVAAAMEDPNPLVSGKGFSDLRAAGIEVAAGLLEAEARELNRPYCRWVATGRPFVTVKLAVSLDGQIAAASGDSRWVSGEKARQAVHRMRAEADAVLIGGKTLRRDDPLLTARIPGARDPKRVVLASKFGRIERLRIFREGKGEVLLVSPRKLSPAEAGRVEALGAKVLSWTGKSLRPEALLDALGKEGVLSLLVEGGGRVAGWLAEAGAVDRFVFFIAPRLLGEGVRAMSGFAARTVGEGPALRFVSVRRVGDDLMVVAEPIRAGTAKEPR